MSIYSALDIAKYAIAYEHKKDREISNLRLQKLLYFIQAKSLIETDKPCFSDDIEAWAFGPVVPAVYHTYKLFGGMDILITPQDIFLDRASEKLVSDMLEACAPYPSYQLVSITHKQDPWINARAKGQKTIITHDAIKEYFKKKKA